jgi:hypothetical protein
MYTVKVVYLDGRKPLIFTVNDVADIEAVVRDDVALCKIFYIDVTMALAEAA